MFPDYEPGNLLENYECIIFRFYVDIDHKKKLYYYWFIKLTNWVIRLVLI